MPIIQSAKKRVRQTERKTAFNRATKTRYRNAMKVVTDAVAKNDTAGAEKALPAAYKYIDIAAKKHVLHKKTAARRKSVLVRIIRGKTQTTTSKKKVAAPVVEKEEPEVA